MKKITLPNSLVLNNKQTSLTVLQTSRRRWYLTLFVSFMAGGVCGIVGTTLGLTSLLGLLNANRPLDHAGTALLVVAFPLIILTAHSLDKAREADKAIRIEYWRRTGTIDDDDK